MQWALYLELFRDLQSLTKILRPSLKYPLPLLAVLIFIGRACPVSQRQSNITGG